ncbi:hypothetical protein HDV00_011264 [Rhizophlyctis rosea]|nr:hypothetical protein HDV00_011264 [Rhizophlyctis rosea]
MDTEQQNNEEEVVPQERQSIEPIHSRAAPQTEDEANEPADTVECPCCQARVPPSAINDHLDTRCPALHAQSTKPTPTHSSSSTPSTRQKVQTKLHTTPTGTLARQPSSLTSPSHSHSQKRKFPPQSVDTPTNPYEPPQKQAKSAAQSRKDAHTPLAELARPMTLDEFCGQANLVGEGKLLRSLMEQQRVPSLIFWGPPGTGKTTLARIIAKSQNTYYREMSATTNNVADVRKAAEDAKNHKLLTGRKPIIFLDEIHRFTKAQQDFFLPPVEQGDFTLIAATTENPSFRVNGALLSRCRVFVLDKLTETDLLPLLRRAAGIKIATTGGGSLDIPDGVLVHLAQMCDGDARTAVNALEMAMDGAVGRGEGGVNVEGVREALQKGHLLYDKDGEEHYNIS